MCSAFWIPVSYICRVLGHRRTVFIDVVVQGRSLSVEIPECHGTYPIPNNFGIHRWNSCALSWESSSSFCVRIYFSLMSCCCSGILHFGTVYATTPWECSTSSRSEIDSKHIYLDQATEKWRWKRLEWIRRPPWKDEACLRGHEWREFLWRGGCGTVLCVALTVFVEQEERSLKESNYWNLLCCVGRSWEQGCEGAWEEVEHRGAVLPAPSFPIHIDHHFFIFIFFFLNIIAVLFLYL